MGIKTTLFTAALVACSLPLSAQNTPIAQMEHLDRGVVALPASSSGIFVSWRLLGTDDDVHTTFDVLSNGLVVGKNISKATSYQHAGGKQGNLYQVVTKVDGVPVDTSEAVTPWKQVYLPLKLNRPAGGTLDGAAYSYSPNDMSVGDVDGDGQYELFVKWDPSNAKDNSQSGVTGNVIIDCYKLDGTQLWRVDLGRNIRAGAHYTQYLVFLVLLERDGIRVGDLCCRLYLDNGTLTPVLKKMEAAGYLKRERCPEDERAVRVFLTDKGHGMVRQLEDVPARVGSCLRLSPEEAGALYGLLYRLLEQNGCKEAGSGASGK